MEATPAPTIEAYRHRNRRQQGEHLNQILNVEKTLKKRRKRGIFSTLEMGHYFVFPALYSLRNARQVKELTDLINHKYLTP